jgi:hypothetical protein
MVNRVIQARLCTYFELQSGSLHDLFTMLRIADWNDFVIRHSERHDN